MIRSFLSGALIVAALLLMPLSLGALESRPANNADVAFPVPPTYAIRNVGGRDGAGLCVFTSINWAALMQGEQRLARFQAQMRAELGGGWPEKVDAMIAKYAPGVSYLQDESADWELLLAAVRSRRVPSVTYCGHDPHYGKNTIAHMVNVIDATPERVVIRDNNFPAKDVVLTAREFRDRWEGKRFLVWNGSSYQPVGGGWAVYLLHTGVPPRITE